MRLQLLSDLHLETERFTPQPAPDAELLVLAGDIDSRWTGLELFRDWPVPVLFVAGNHEFDGREFTTTLAALRARCDSFGIRLLECESLVIADREGRRIRFVATTRWCDFDLFGDAGRLRAMRAAKYYMSVMKATLNQLPFDPAAVREVALDCRTWLAAELSRRSEAPVQLRSEGDSIRGSPMLRAKNASQPLAGPAGATVDWDRSVVVTHFAPSLRSADPRYGRQPGTASFCNADDDLLAFADLWIHGHLHCRHDYRVEHAGGHSTRVVCHSRGHAHKGEAEGFEPLRVLEI